jgi:apolipoprotein N-acyltransferase
VSVPARRGSTALPALVAGGLLALSLPPWGWWPLGPAGAALLYWRLAGQRARTRMWAGWLAGLGCYGPGLMWSRAFNWYGAALLIVLEALFFAAAALCTPPLRGRAPAFVAAGTLAEAARMTWPFGGLPLGGVFLGQADGPLLQLARLGGPLLLTAGVWAGGTGLATIVSGLASRRSGRRAGSRAGMPSGTVVALRGAAILAVLSLAVVLGSVAPDGGPVVRSITVAAVQGGGKRGLDKEEVAPATVFAAQLRATRPLLAKPSPSSSPSLVLWPEDVIALSGPLHGSLQGAEMAQEARNLHATLVAGVTVPVSPTAFRNEIVVWAADGRIVGSFEKVHRVPFGEYVPYRSFISHVADLSEVPTDAIPGHGTGLVRTPAGPLGTLVSFEVFYANRSRASVRAGAELLIVPTNTSSYATAQVPTQEVAADAVQAVETGRSVVQAAPTGYSTVVDERGRVLARSVLGRRQRLTATVPLRRGFTPYDHLGDLPFLVLAGVGLVAAWAHQRRAARYAWEPEWVGSP